MTIRIFQKHMNFETRILFLALLSLCSTIVVFAQIAAPSAARSAAANVRYSFEGPEGWKKVVDDLGYTFTSPGEGVIVLVRPHGENDFAKAVRTTEIDSTYKVIGEPRVLDNGGRSFRVTKVLSNGTTGVVDVFIMLSPNGGGVIVMALSGVANSDNGYKIGNAVANSVTFPGAASASRTGPTAPSNSMTGSPWETRLSNKHLLFLYSGSGYFEERHYYLCSSGTFYYKAGSGGFTPGNADGGSFAGQSGNRGRWGVNGSTLVLQFQNGNVAQFTLTERQARNEVGLNGKRYFVEAQPNCQ
jgi:hypothetical protein